MSTFELAPVIELAWCLIALAPFLIPLFLVIRGWRKTPSRWLFVLLVATSGYGFFTLLGIPVVLLMNLLDSLAGPQVTGYPTAPEWAIPIIANAYVWMYGVVALLTAVFSIVLARFLFHRWPRIARR